YRVEKVLGAGGIGAVYSAVHVRTGRRYAVKVLLPHAALRPSSIPRFRAEAQALASIGHAGIVAIHDFDVTEDGLTFLVMDLLEGEDLQRRISRGPLNLENALRIITDVSDALTAAHDLGFVHRDLKPANIFLAKRPGDSERATLLDFGLAKMLEAP